MLQFLRDYLEIELKKWIPENVQKSKSGKPLSTVWSQPHKIDSNKIECESLKVVVSLELENLNLQWELNSTWGIYAITLYT